MFLGLDLGTSELKALLLTDTHEVIATEPPLQALSLVGGGAHDTWWAQLLADTLCLTLRVHAGGETGAALGAARLAWLACSSCIRPADLKLQGHPHHWRTHARLHLRQC